MDNCITNITNNTTNNMPDALDELFNETVDTDFEDASEEIESPTLILNYEV